MKVYGYLFSLSIGIVILFSYVYNKAEVKIPQISSTIKTPSIIYKMYDPAIPELMPPKEKIEFAGIDVAAMIYANISAETDFRHRGMKHKAGERGYMQIRYVTWKDACKYLKVQWSYLPAVWERNKNILVGTAYLYWLLERWEAKGYSGITLLQKVILSYNAGFTKVLQGRDPWRSKNIHWNQRFKPAYLKYKNQQDWRTTEIGWWIQAAIIACNKIHIERKHHGNKK